VRQKKAAHAPSPRHALDFVLPFDQALQPCISASVLLVIKVLPPDISMDEHIVKRLSAGSQDISEARPHQHHPDLSRRERGRAQLLVMKYIAGTSLEDVLDQKQPLTIDYIPARVVGKRRAPSAMPINAASCTAT